MPSPPSPITIFAQKMNAAPSLKSVAKVLAGKNALVTGRAPPSIVIFPHSAGYKASEDIVTSFVDVDIQVAARLWGRNIDEAWDLRARFVAALWTQANPDPTNADDSIAGYYFKFIDETWDIIPDTAEQGQELEVLFTLRLSASEKTIQYGEVDAETLTRTATLTTALGTSDAVAFVDETVGGYGSSGVLHIDGEQLAYSGTTATSFTGLVRGINGTTAAAHLSGATVSVTPT